MDKFRVKLIQSNSEWIAIIQKKFLDILKIDLQNDILEINLKNNALYINKKPDIL